MGLFLNLDGGRTIIKHPSDGREDFPGRTMARSVSLPRLFNELRLQRGQPFQLSKGEPFPYLLRIYCTVETELKGAKYGNNESITGYTPVREETLGRGFGWFNFPERKEKLRDWGGIEVGKVFALLAQGT